MAADTQSTLSEEPSSALDEVLTSQKWQVDCDPAKKSDSVSCVAFQQVKATPSERTVLGVMFAKNKQDTRPHLVLRFSGKADTSKGVAIKVDKHDFYRAPINGCGEAACEVKTLIDDTLLLQMLKGENMYVAFFIDGVQVTYPASLDDFDAAVKEVVTSI
jgi:invasion protein IalB